MSKADEFLTVADAAKRARVSESTVRRWCDRGVLPHGRTASGVRLVKRGDLVAFMRRNNTGR